MNHGVSSRGFTLIELVLAMGFVSVLLLAIAMTVIQIGGIYNKGLTLKEVNQAGRSLTVELKRSITQSSPFDVSLGSNSRYIVQDWGGRLCIGMYSYVWNYGAAIAKADTTKLNVYATNSSETIRLAKVIDPSASYCIVPSKKVIFEDAVELLNVGEHNLAIHSFTIASSDLTSDSKTGQKLYNIEFEIGTNNQSALANDATGAIICKAPGTAGSDSAYCSVIQFNIVALAGNYVQ